MFNKAYIISFDKGGLLDTFDYVGLHNTLIAADGILSWWHYLETSYIVITSSNITASNIASYVMQLMPNKHFFVSELNLENHNGFLPQEAWDWINQNKSIL